MSAPAIGTQRTRASHERFPTLTILTVAGYAYLLRVPVLIFAFVFYLALAGILPGLPGESVIRGIFDVAWSSEQHFVNGLRFALVTVAVFTLAGSLTVVSRTICLGGQPRFRLRKVNDSSGPRLLYALPPLALAAFILVGVVKITSISIPIALTGELAGFMTFAVVVYTSRLLYQNWAPVRLALRTNVSRAQEVAVKSVQQVVTRMAPRYHAVAVPQYQAPPPQAPAWPAGKRIAGLFCIGLLAFAIGIMFKNRWIGILTILFNVYLGSRGVRILHTAPARTVVPGDTEGYALRDDSPMLPRHVFAALLFMVSFSLYGFVFLVNDRTHTPGLYFKIPTLALVLLLMILICWAFSGLSFFLDRYRIPLILPIVLWASFASSFSQSDHFYLAIPAPRMPDSQTPAAILYARSTPAILVAATGGGIQAASWSARVLRGLQAEAQLENLSFADSVRLISSVSGGSVGSMYFQSMYDPAKTSDCAKNVITTVVGGRNDPELSQTLAKNIDDDCVVRAAEASSLDEIAFGLVYPDVFLNLFPFIKGVDIRHLKIVNGEGILDDRARALENSFKRGPLPGLSTATLFGWKEEVRQGLRPAAIFNATIVETGERLLFTTTDMADPSRNGDSYRPLGRVSFHHLYPNWDVQVATAVRLSATFPYVTPAARVFQGDIYSPSDHVADGGYFDNFGMASLVEWLHEAIHGSSNVRDTMVVEIRSSAVSEPLIKTVDPLVANSQHDDRGFLFQLFHPASTLWNVRGTGQFSHNEVELNLLQEATASSGHICRAVFEFHDQSGGFHPRPEPLSWHLTRQDIHSLSDAWKWYMSDNAEIRKVIQFVKEGSCPKT